MSAYRVFAQSPDATVEGVWIDVGVYEASSDDAAKQAAAVAHGDGTYSAAPERSWQPSAYTVAPRAVAVKAAT